MDEWRLVGAGWLAVVSQRSESSETVVFVAILK
jgi:hypothetical protein